MKWKVNDEIRGPMVRVVVEKGEQLGVLPIKDSLAKAREVGLDLIEIAPHASPPVVQMEDFGKFRYREEKKLRKQKKGAKKSELKEIRFSPFIGTADYDTRIARINEFLSDKQKVKVVIKFTGRQMGSQNYGYRLIAKILDSVGREKINIDMEPKFLGRHLVMIISPIGKNKKDEETKKDQS